MLNHAITMGDVLASSGVCLLAALIALAVGCYGFSRSWW